MRRHWYWWAAVTLAALATVLGLPTAALASCAAGPTPSPYRFVGTVVSLSDDGRVAEVQPRAGGAQVEVRGTDAGPGSGTSVDRSYQLHGIYEFDPVNARSPYRDDICTATRLLRMAAAEGQVRSAHAMATRVDNGQNPSGWALWALVLGGVALTGALGGVVLLSRRWHSSATATGSGPGAGS